MLSRVNKRSYPATEDMPDARAPYQVRVEFVIELARRLHMYGTTAQRLEGAVTSVARRIDVYCEVWSNPTGMILSFADFQRSHESSITRVIRLDPGDDHLGKLARADFIAEEVLAGRMHIPEGLEALRALDTPSRTWAAPLRVLCYGLASASVTGLLPRTGWADLVTAALLGCFIGVLGQLSERRPRLQDAQDAMNQVLPEKPGWTGSLVSMDPRTGFVKAMVAGPGLESSQYTHATSYPGSQAG